jgi:hypothetical protein
VFGYFCCGRSGCYSEGLVFGGMLWAVGGLMVFISILLDYMTTSLALVLVAKSILWSCYSNKNGRSYFCKITWLTIGYGTEKGGPARLAKAPFSLPLFPPHFPFIHNLQHGHGKSFLLPCWNRVYLKPEWEDPLGFIRNWEDLRITMSKGTSFKQKGWSRSLKINSQHGIFADT